MAKFKENVKLPRSGVENYSCGRGAEIFAGYLEDQALVESIEQANLSRDLFTLQFVERAVTKAFPKERDAILGDLVRLLLFDAMVGNNDSHFYNWAVIQPFDKRQRARFSPAYDTARGLFWNSSDEQLLMRVRQKDVARSSTSLATRCAPFSVRRCSQLCRTC